NQVSKVRAILVAPGGQLHLYHRIKRGHLKFGRSLRFFDFRQIVIVVSSNPLPGIEEMDSAAGFALRAVDKCIDAQEFAIDKADSFKTRFRGSKVRTPDQDIDITRISNSLLVNPGDPLGDGVAADDSVPNFGRVEGSCGSTQSFFDLFGRHER